MYTNQEKIVIVEKALDYIRRDVFTFCCNALACAIGPGFSTRYVLDEIPEFLQFKPADKLPNRCWWDMREDDKLKRIEVLTGLLNLLKKNEEN